MSGHKHLYGCKQMYCATDSFSAVRRFPLSGPAGPLGFPLGSRARSPAAKLCALRLPGHSGLRNLGQAAVSVAGSRRSQRCRLIASPGLLRGPSTLVGPIDPRIASGAGRDEWFAAHSASPPGQRRSASSLLTPKSPSPAVWICRPRGSSATGHLPRLSSLGTGEASPYKYDRRPRGSRCRPFARDDSLRSAAFWHPFRLSQSSA